MDLLFWIILIVCLILGPIGLFIPILPGLIIYPILTATLYFLYPGTIENLTLWASVILFLLSFPIDIFSTFIGAKWGGASWWGLTGATVGGFIGLFFSLPGVIFGPLIGAFVGETLFASKTPDKAIKAGIGASFGLMISTVFKLFLALIMTFWIIYDVIN